MQRNITMAIDEKLLKKARKIASDQNTSVNNLIRLYLEWLFQKENMKREVSVSQLEALFDNSEMKIGERNWSRDQLYER
jgi:hypothetical protein